MDESIKTIYRLIFKKNARIARVVEYKGYYEILLEWEADDVVPEIAQDFGECVETQLVALIKPRR